VHVSGAVAADRQPPPEPGPPEGARHEPVFPGDGPTELAAGGPDSVGVMLGIVGDEWNLLIVREAVQEARRFGDWKRRLPISNAVLTNRLGQLTEAGVLARHAYQDNPVRFEYVLTVRGRALWPVLLTIWDWERRWVPEHSTAMQRMVHRGCGRSFGPLLTCGCCGREAVARDVAVGPGPGGTWARSAPAAATRRRSGAAADDRPGLFPATMALIGNRWSSALLGAAFRGATRFGDFLTFLGAPPAVVADRLRTFCDLGVLAPLPDQDRAGRARYRLTDKGRAFFPVVVTSLQWGQDWFRSPEGPAVEMRHRPCGAGFVPRLMCDACREPLTGQEIEPA
jgi:DNA-binding HxlR family transcriptional regulator